MNSASTHLPAEARLQQQLSLVVRVPWDRALSESGGSRTCPGLVVPVLHIFSISHRDTFLSIFKNRDFSSQFLKVFFYFYFFFHFFIWKAERQNSYLLVHFLKAHNSQVDQSKAQSGIPSRFPAGTAGTQLPEPALLPPPRWASTGSWTEYWAGAQTQVLWCWTPGP